MIAALYRCLRCAFEWEAKPEPVVCPKCGDIYVVRADYKSRRLPIIWFSAW